MLGDKQDSESISDPEQADYAKLVVDNIRKEIKVSKVKIEGVVHTNFEFLELITRDLLQAKNVGDVIIGSRNIGAKLKKLGIFKSVEIELKANPERDNVLDIVYIVEESPRIYASTGADFGASDTNMVKLFN